MYLETKQFAGTSVVLATTYLSENRVNDIIYEYRFPSRQNLHLKIAKMMQKICRY